MKKRILIIVLLVVAVILLLAAYCFLRTTPVLEADVPYQIADISFYPEGIDADRQHLSTEDLNALGEEWSEAEGQMLASLAPCTQRRSTELFFHRKGTPVQVPDWLRLNVLLVDEEGTPISILLGEVQGQRRSSLYNPPVYNISHADQLYEEWMEALEPIFDAALKAHHQEVRDEILTSFGYNPEDYSYYLDSGLLDALPLEQYYDIKQLLDLNAGDYIPGYYVDPSQTTIVAVNRNANEENQLFLFSRTQDGTWILT